MADFVPSRCHTNTSLEGTVFWLVLKGPVPYTGVNVNYCRLAPITLPTQLFFFFFLASASLLLPMLEWLVMLLRLEMLSEEFCLLIRSSIGQNKWEEHRGRFREVMRLK